MTTTSHHSRDGHAQSNSRNISFLDFSSENQNSIKAIFSIRVCLLYVFAFSNICEGYGIWLLGFPLT